MKKLPHPPSHRLRARVATATALLAALAATPAAQASLVITFVEMGGGVVAIGSGSIDSSDFSYMDSRMVPPLVHAPTAYATLGPLGEVDVWTTTNFSGPGGFGAGTLGQNFADSGSGETFGIDANDQRIILPQGYASGGTLYGSATFVNTSFANLGLDPGTYVWTFGSGEHADRSAGVLASQLVEVVELKGHPWFLGTQAHPEFQSKPNKAHPLFAAFIAAALKEKRKDARSRKGRAKA